MLADQALCPFLRLARQLLRLLQSVLQRPLAILLDAPGLPDLLGHEDAHLV
jgi:hypothetical protein